VTPVRTSSRSRSLELLELVEQTVPHLDDSRRHGDDVLLPFVEQLRLGQDQRYLSRSERQYIEHPRSEKGDVPGKHRMQEGC
jgi:hypothetical protein